MKAAFALVWCVALLLIPGLVEAHARLVETSPFANATQINGAAVTPQFYDTFNVPPGTTGSPGSITFRVRFKEFRGKAVYHCHILPHEDTGMMNNLQTARRIGTGLIFELGRELKARDGARTVKYSPRAD